LTKWPPGEAAVVTDVDDADDATEEFADEDHGAHRKPNELKKIFK
jgi:hypothetical protein